MEDIRPNNKILEDLRYVNRLTGNEAIIRSAYNAVDYIERLHFAYMELEAAFEKFKETMNHDI